MGMLGTAGRVALAKTGGVASSVTPSPALNWTGILYYSEGAGCQDYTEERIQGITQTITLGFSVSASSGFPPLVQYFKSNNPHSSNVNYCDASPNFTSSSPLPEGRSSGFSTGNLYNGSSLVISSLTAAPNEYLAFISSSNGPPFGTNSVTIQINNSSDGNALLDTIEFQATF